MNRHWFCRLGFLVLLLFPIASYAQFYTDIHYPRPYHVVNGVFDIQATSSLPFSVYLSERYPTDETLVYSSDTAVSNGFAGRLDTGVLASGDYTLRLVDTQGNSATVGFVVDSMAKEGWPSAETEIFSPITKSMIAADLEEDGQWETIISTWSNNAAQIVVFDSQGRIKSGWPVSLGDTLARTVSPLVADLDRTEPGMEIIAVWEDLVDGQNNIVVSVFNHSGVELRQKSFSITNVGSSFKAAIGNIDESVDEEIVIVENNKIFILNGSLEVVKYFSLPEHQNIYSMVVAELDDTQGEDVLLAITDCLEYSSEGQCEQKQSLLSAYSINDQLWTKSLGDRFFGDLMAVDIDRDLKMNIIGVAHENSFNSTKYIELLDHNGNPLEGTDWTLLDKLTPPSKLTVIAPIEKEKGEIHLAVFKERGSSYSQPYPYAETLRYLNAFGETVVDENGTSVYLTERVGYIQQKDGVATMNLDSDPELEFLVRAGYQGYGGGISCCSIYALDHDGSMFSDTVFRQNVMYTISNGQYHYRHWGSPNLVDIDSDGKLDVSASGSRELGFYWESAELAINNDELFWGTAKDKWKNKKSYYVNYAESNYKQMFFRGTPNGFGLKRMQLVDDYQWQVRVVFDGNPDNRFKFDAYGDWSENYGDNEDDGISELFGDDIYIDYGSGEYVITFNERTLEYSMSHTGRYRDLQLPQFTDITISTGQQLFYLPYIYYCCNGITRPDLNADYNLIESSSDQFTQDLSSGFLHPVIPDGKYIFEYGLKMLPARRAYNGAYVDPLYEKREEIMLIVGEKTNIFDQPYFRGTPNNFLMTDMVRVKEHLWETLAIFEDGEENPRFKIDVSEDWSENYGDSDGDGVLDFFGEDISVTHTGPVYIRFNEKDMTYTVSPKAPTTNVQFVCHDMDVKSDEGVYVVGNIPELGDWGARRDTRLRSDKKGNWSLTKRNIPADSDIEWKCIVANDVNLATQEWESGENNRVHTLLSETDVITTRGNF